MTLNTTTPRIRKDMLKWFDGIADKLGDLWQECGDQLSLEDFTLEVEHRYGSWIYANVCTQYQMIEASCLIVAAEVGRRVALRRREMVQKMESSSHHAHM